MWTVTIIESAGKATARTFATEDAADDYAQGVFDAMDTTEARDTEVTVTRSRVETV